MFVVVAVCGGVGGSPIDQCHQPILKAGTLCGGRERKRKGKFSSMKMIRQFPIKIDALCLSKIDLFFFFFFFFSFSFFSFFARFILSISFFSPENK